MFSREWPKHSCIFLLYMTHKNNRVALYTRKSVQCQCEVMTWQLDKLKSPSTSQGSTSQRLGANLACLGIQWDTALFSLYCSATHGDLKEDPNHSRCALALAKPHIAHPTQILALRCFSSRFAKLILYFASHSADHSVLPLNFHITNHLAICQSSCVEPCTLLIIVFFLAICIPPIILRFALYWADHSMLSRALPTICALPILVLCLLCFANHP